MLEHGGHLMAAAKKYNIAKENWLDLSTGINPIGWPVPAIPSECWQRLPETADKLMVAAQQYYQCLSILPIAGSQAAIQTLPLLREKSKVGVLSLAYAEHAYCWQKAGHEVIELSVDTIESQCAELDVLILINPNNPTGHFFNKDQLLDWHQKLKQRKGWLIIDEAFIDTMPEHSLSQYPATEGLIILRSLGKFFGLAGIRCGFVIATEQCLNDLNEKLGPWAISHPSRYIATKALLDKAWQQKTQIELTKQSKQLAILLTEYNLKPDGQTDLFVWVRTENAEALYKQFAQAGILIRLFNHPSSLRFGLPKNETQWLKLKNMLQTLRDNYVQIS